MPSYLSLPRERKAAAPSQGAQKAPYKICWSHWSLTLTISAGIDMFSSNMSSQREDTLGSFIFLADFRNATRAQVLTCLLNLIYKIKDQSQLLHKSVPIWSGDMGKCHLHQNELWLSFILYTLRIVKPGAVLLVAVHAPLNKTKHLHDILYMPFS